MLGLCTGSVVSSLDAAAGLELSMRRLFVEGSATSDEVRLL